MVTMSQGLEHVEAAIELIERASDTIGGLGGVQEDWKSEAVARLDPTTALLRGVTDRFFLKTRVCLPFAGKCEEEAKKLDALLAELCAQPASDGQDRLDAALEALERAVKTLDERSLMRGMSIT
jgi:hypothetical protein